MADDWEFSEEECARMEREARILLEQQRTCGSQSTVSQQSAMPASSVFRADSTPSIPSSGFVRPGSKTFVVNVFSVSDDKIGTKSAYHQGLKDSLKSVEGSSWDGTQRCWVFPKANLKRVIHVIQQFRGLSAEVQLSSDLLKLHSSMEPNRNLSHPPPLLSPSPSPAATPASQPLDSFKFDPSVPSSLRGPCLEEAQPVGAERHPSGGPAPYTEYSRVPFPSLVNATGGRLEFRSLKLEPFSGGTIRVTFKALQALSEAVGRLQGAEKLPDDGRAFNESWIVPFRELEQIRSLATKVAGVKIEVQELQPIQSRVLHDFSSFPDDTGMISSLPAKMKKDLMPFQKDGIQFALKRGGRMLCADEMGLGKTVQALGLAACYREDWPVLVIVPSSLRLHWAMSICSWLDVSPLDVTVLVANSGSVTSRDGFNFVRCSKDSTVELKGLFNVVSYDLIDRVANDFKMIIVDESHYLKNYKAKRTNICCPRLQKAKRAVLLTGTPALSRPIELYKQLEALQPKAYRSMREYGDRYCQGSFFGQYNGSSNMGELHNLLSSTIMIRRLKKDVLPQLPDKRRQQVVLMLSDKAMTPIKKTTSALQSIRKVLQRVPDQDGDQAVQMKLKEQNLINQLYQETAEAKADSVKEYLSNLVETGTKFLVFAHHLSMLNVIEELVKHEASKPGYIRIDGSTPHDKRQELVEKFQKDANVTVAILAIRAAGVGLTLTGASTVVFAELAWNPGDLIQAEDRAHRIGQRSSVNIYYLHAPDTADDIIWQVVQAKFQTLGTALDGQQNAWSLERCKQQEAKQTQLKIDFLRSSSNQAPASDRDQGLVNSPPLQPKDGGVEGPRPQSQLNCSTSTPEAAVHPVQAQNGLGASPLVPGGLHPCTSTAAKIQESCEQQAPALASLPQQHASPNISEMRHSWGASCKKLRSSLKQA